MALSQTQEDLLKQALQYTGLNCPVKFDVLKDLCNCRSFDSTFNALLFKGYFEHVETNDYSNQFKATNKAMSYKF